MNPELGEYPPTWSERLRKHGLPLFIIAATFALALIVLARDLA